MTAWLREDAADFLTKERRSRAPVLGSDTPDELVALRRVLEGRGSEQFEKADALSPEQPPAREPACPTCGKIFGNQGAYTRHRIATGHDAPKRRVENAEVAGRTDAEAGYVAKAAKPTQRYTFSPLYLPATRDAHSEFADADSLQKAAWAYFRDGDRKLRRQHDKSKVVGEVVEMVSWPYAHESDMTQADGTVRKQKFPPHTIFIGTVWTPAAFPEVLSGKLNGYSMGGSCVRTRGVPLP
jgi:Putative phage serine protease XkdF